MHDRERRYRSLIEKFPENAFGYFSLAKYFAEVGRSTEAVPLLERCVEKDPQWAAALLALERCKAAATAQSHASLAAEAEERIAKL